MLKKTYRRLRQEDRHTIHRMSKALKTQKEIAQAIGFSQSTVSKELSRNLGKCGYRPKQAHCLSQERQASKAKRPIKILEEIKDQVEQRLSLRHSPEQISGALALLGHSLSHECIYQYIIKDKALGGTLYKQLRINGTRRYRRRCKASRLKIPNRVGIEQRPSIIQNRERYGDWEADLIEGKHGSGYLLSLFERKSRTGKLLKLSSKSSQETAEGIISLLREYKVRSITYDNGLEFSKHQEVSEKLHAKAYFCQPYHSWEKGAVENFNGLVRQYVPKGASLDPFTSEKLAAIENEINERPRKMLGFNPPSKYKNKIAA